MGKKWLDILKIPGIVVGCIVTIIGVYKAIESIPDRVEASNKALVEEVKSTVKLYNDSTNAQFKSIENILDEHGNKLDGVIRSQTVLKNIVTREFAKTMTPQQVLEMMEQFDLQKKSEYINEIPCESDNTLTQYTLK